MRLGARPSVMFLRVGTAATVFGLTAAALTLGQVPAAGSCISATPPRSAYAFTGVVVATSSGGRVAQVRTDAGRTVEVRGTDAPGANQATSVDRTYRVGGRYEFHPTNTAPPWADNSCTATRLLSLGPVGNSGASQLNTHDHRWWLAVTGASFAALLAAAAAAWVLLLRRRRAAPAPDPQLL